MTPEKSIQLRRSSGSPNPKEQDEMIKLATAKIAGYRAGVQKRTKFVQGALKNLSRTIAKYL
jgi:hypothetical protein